jgi:chemotaxis receptor (MCP) glutamine deamidase CheD
LTQFYFYSLSSYEPRLQRYPCHRRGHIRETTVDQDSCIGIRARDTSDNIITRNMFSKKESKLRHSVYTVAKYGNYKLRILVIINRMGVTRSTSSALLAYTYL